MIAQHDIKANRLTTAKNKEQESSHLIPEPAKKKA